MMMLSVSTTAGIDLMSSVCAWGWVVEERERALAITVLGVVGGWVL